MDLELNTIYGQGLNDAFHQRVAFFTDPGIENKVINIYPDEKDQVFEGFGGAVTDSAGYVYAHMDAVQRELLLHTYFSEEEMNYSLLRVPLDSCDFSLRQHEAVSDLADSELQSFSLAGMNMWIFPLLDDIRKAAGRDLPLLLSPWSPPAFMKTNSRREQGGKLEKEYYGRWAAYLCRYIEEFRHRGYTVAGITLQNEPKAAQTWDSCVFTAQEQKEFLKDHMFPLMKKRGLSDIGIFLWDHNKERLFEWVRDIIDEETDPMIAGAAFHWYSGDHFDALDLVRKHCPDKKLIVSESCIEYSKYDPSDITEAALSLAHEIIGDMNHGITAFYDWNLLLDENGGPNYVNNYCLAPFHYDFKKKELRPNLIQKFYREFSHYLTKGSVRLSVTVFSDQIETTAWERPDGRIVTFMLNRTDRYLPVCLRINGSAAEFILHPRSLSTGQIFCSYKIHGT